MTQLNTILDRGAPPVPEPALDAVWHTVRTRMEHEPDVVSTMRAPAAPRRTGTALLGRRRARVALAAAGFVGGSCSVGVATATPDDADFATVLARADVALYDAKPASRDRKPDHGPIENPPSAPHS